MIRIDDLVRQRLSDGEEPKSPGAWLAMRELLDKEMPVASGYNWRRIIGYLSLLLLLGFASVGGYEWYQSGIGIGAAAGNGGTETASAEGATGTLTHGEPAHDPHAIGDASTHADHTTAKQALASNAQMTAGHSVGNGTAMSSSDARVIHPAPASMAANATLPVTAKNSLKNGNSLPSQGTQRPKQHATEGLALNAPRDRKNERETLKNTSLKSIAQSVSATVPGVNKADHTQAANADRLAKLGASSRTPLSVPQLRQPSLARIRHDSVQRLELVYRRVFDAASERYFYRIDTFPVGKFARNIFLPLPKEEDAVAATATQTQKSAKPHHDLLARKARKSDAAPAIAAKQSAPATAPETNNAVASADKPLPNAAASDEASSAEKESAATKLTAAAGTKHFQLYDFTRLAATIDKVKSELARIEMYPGVMAGINASMFTPNALGGFQLGLTSLLIVNDWWSVMTELKYYQRFNTGSSIRDDYKQVINGKIESAGQINGQPYNAYTWTESSIRHGFNYDVVRTFEVPVMLRRNWGRAFAQGGLNFVFSSAITATESLDSLDDYIGHKEFRPATQNGPFINNDHPLVQMSDFGPRIGVGYVFSGGIMFTPSVYLDARVTQTFWDNSKSDGAKQVSRDLLRTPSIQLSVGYRFQPKK